MTYNQNQFNDKILKSLETLAINLSDNIKANVLLQNEILKLQTKIIVLEVKVNELKLNQKNDANEWI